MICFHFEVPNCSRSMPRTVKKNVPAGANSLRIIGYTPNP